MTNKTTESLKYTDHSVVLWCDHQFNGSVWQMDDWMETDWWSMTYHNFSCRDPFRYCIYMITRCKWCQKFQSDIYTVAEHYLSSARVSYWWVREDTRILTNSDPSTNIFYKTGKELWRLSFTTGSNLLRRVQGLSPSAAKLENLP